MPRFEFVVRDEMRRKRFVTVEAATKEEAAQKARMRDAQPSDCTFDEEIVDSEVIEVVV